MDFKFEPSREIMENHFEYIRRGLFMSKYKESDYVPFHIELAKHWSRDPRLITFLMLHSSIDVAKVFAENCYSFDLIVFIKRVTIDVLNEVIPNMIKNQDFNDDCAKLLLLKKIDHYFYIDIMKKLVSKTNLVEYTGENRYTDEEILNNIDIFKYSRNEEILSVISSYMSKNNVYEILDMWLFESNNFRHHESAKLFYDYSEKEIMAPYITKLIDTSNWAVLDIFKSSTNVLDSLVDIFATIPVEYGTLKRRVVLNNRLRFVKHSDIDIIRLAFSPANLSEDIKYSLMAEIPFIENDSIRIEIVKLYHEVIPYDTAILLKYDSNKTIRKRIEKELKKRRNVQC